MHQEKLTYVVYQHQEELQLMSLRDSCLLKFQKKITLMAIKSLMDAGASVSFIGSIVIINFEGSLAMIARNYKELLKISDWAEGRNYQEVV